MSIPVRNHPSCRAIRLAKGHSRERHPGPRNLYRSGTSGSGSCLPRWWRNSLWIGILLNHYGKVPAVDPSNVASILERDGIIDQSADTAELTVSEAFASEVASVRASLTEQGQSEEIVTDAVDDTEAIQLLNDVEDTEFIATFVVLNRQLQDVPTHVKAQSALALTAITSAQQSPEEIPRIFLPVGFDRLQTALKFVPKAVVYVWLEDCPTCEIVRDDFDELFTTPPPDIGWFAVYGPDCSERLYDTYEVVGGPTVLFFVDGEVDTRLQGAQPRQTLEQEIQYLRDIDIAA